ncbi:hypothetical protein [Phenylobacterium sp.]|uniref:hypothetical protein n=1 Tax=Phenylobacterium sp. TaxID=1871053 RepID=UPI002F4175B7
MEFAKQAELDRETAQRLQRRTREDEERQEKKEENERKEVAEEVIAHATKSDIANFTVTLDRYDEATVSALMENGVELRAAQERVDKMLLKAHTLPDGRKVFLTEDGTRVFDQHGTELKANEVKPDEIDPHLTRWETFRHAKHDEQRLTDEREELHAYQGKLDNARERTKDPDLSKAELEALDKELREEAPERVRQKVGNDHAKPEISAEQALENELGPAKPERGSQRRAEPAPA